MCLHDASTRSFLQTGHKWGVHVVREFNEALQAANIVDAAIRCKMLGFLIGVDQQEGHVQFKQLKGTFIDIGFESVVHENLLSRIRRGYLGALILISSPVRLSTIARVVVLRRGTLW